MKLIFCLCCLLFLPVVQAKEKAATLNKEFVVDSISVEMKNINDVGMVFVSHQDGSLALAGQAAWGIGFTGLAGKAEVDLAPFLKRGENFVVFVLWNKPGKSIETKYYTKTFMDKWSYEVALYGDGTNIFHQSDEGAGDSGVVYYFAFNVDSYIFGGYEISGASKDQLSKVAARLEGITRDLKNKTAPEGNTDIASMLSVALTGGG
jgi:hypothetical protein